MGLELVKVRPEHLPEIARIIFEAFRGISQAHNFPLDIPNMDLANMIAGMFATRPDFYGVAAILDGTVVGSNFVQVSDEVGGVGPITVDPACQARGIGRALMHHIVAWSVKNHGPMVRLLQDSFNMTSLSLYTSIGFTAAEPSALMEVAPAQEPDPTIRPLTMEDLDACDAQCRRIYKVSRKNELAGMIQSGAAAGIIPNGRFVEGKLAAHIIPGFLGFGVGETADDLLACHAQAARTSPLPVHKAFVPVRNGELFRRALAMKFRCIKIMTLMTLGPYESPSRMWGPSIAF